jgi:peroxiredoxin
MKRLIWLVFVALILASVGVLAFKLARGNAEKEAIAERVKTLPDFRFEAASMLGASMASSSAQDFTPADVAPDKALVIIHFLPDCHFCQGEAKEIAAHAEFFQTAHILMVSAAEMKQIRDFGAHYGLANLPALTLARDGKRAFSQTFGTAGVPATFVYSAAANGKRTLLKQFNGETSAEAIYKALKNNNP